MVTLLATNQQQANQRLLSWFDGIEFDIGGDKYAVASVECVLPTGGAAPQSSVNIGYGLHANINLRKDTWEVKTTPMSQEVYHLFTKNPDVRTVVVGSAPDSHAGDPGNDGSAMDDTSHVGYPQEDSEEVGSA